LQDFNDPRVFQFGGAAKDPRYRTIFLGNDPAHHEEGVNNKKVSPIFPFGRVMALKTESCRRILLVPVAHSGTALVNGPWSVGGKLYENAITQANLAIQTAKAEFAGSDFKGIVWLQGEADLNVAQNVYANFLDNMVKGFRSRIAGAEKAPFVVLQMLPAWIAKTNGNVDRAHQDTPNRLEYCVFVPAPTDKKCGNSDNIHFSAIGSRIIGRNAAMAFDAALQNSFISNPL
jgi:hypothetical protein